MNIKKLSAVTFAALVAPMLAFGATSTLSDVIALVIHYLNEALVLLMGVAVVVFVYNVVHLFIIKSDAEHKDANKYVMWSVVGFFVVLSLWGLVNILLNTFNLGYNTAPTWNSIGGLFPGGSYSSSYSGSGGYNPFSGTNSGSYPTYTGTNSGYNSYSGTNSGYNFYSGTNSGYGTYSGTNSGCPSFYPNCNGTTGSTVSGTNSGTSCPPGDYDPSCFPGTTYGGSGNSSSGTNSGNSSSSCPPGDYDPSCYSSNSTYSGTNSNSNLTPDTYEGQDDRGMDTSPYNSSSNNDAPNYPAPDEY